MASWSDGPLRPYSTDARVAIMYGVTEEEVRAARDRAYRELMTLLWVPVKAWMFATLGQDAISKPDTDSSREAP